VSCEEEDTCVSCEEEDTCKRRLDLRDYSSTRVIRVLVHLLFEKS
jgi:hypothetical protein